MKNIHGADAQARDLSDKPGGDWSDASVSDEEKEGEFNEADINLTTLHQVQRSPYYLETIIPGTFAAGDVRHGAVKRCASAVGEGAMTVTFVHRYLADS